MLILELVFSFNWNNHRIMSIIRTYPRKIAKTPPAITQNIRMLVTNIPTHVYTILSQRMVHGLMPGHIRECADVVVSTPLITPDLCAGFGVLLDEWQLCSGIPLCYDLHYPKCRLMRSVHKSEHPHRRSWWTSAMMLKEKINYLMMLFQQCT